MTHIVTIDADNPDTMDRLADLLAEEGLWENPRYGGTPDTEAGWRAHRVTQMGHALRKFGALVHD